MVKSSGILWICVDLALLMNFEKERSRVLGFTWVLDWILLLCCFLVRNWRQVLRSHWFTPFSFFAGSNFIFFPSSSLPLFCDRVEFFAFEWGIHTGIAEEVILWWWFKYWISENQQKTNIIFEFCWNWWICELFGTDLCWICWICEILVIFVSVYGDFWWFVAVRVYAIDESSWRFIMFSGFCWFWSLWLERESWKVFLWCGPFLCGKRVILWHCVPFI